MKRRLIFLFGVFTVVCGVFAAQGVRNPFWPVGYNGETSPISAEVRPKPPPKKKVDAPKIDLEAERVKTAAKAAEEAAKAKAAAEAAAKKAAEEAAKAAAEAKMKAAITTEDWKAARKSLKIGNPAVFKDADGGERVTININGNIYVDGDLMSITHDSIRFTWRVKGLEGGMKSLKLVRVKAHREPIKK